ncbi:MAG: hypothetical protein KTR25_00985 [Myxococcales bacterium]|nr:hypothetical protein [Myxococcales bacterium]
MNLELSTWVVAGAIDVLMVGFVAAYVFYLRAKAAGNQANVRVAALQKKVEEAKAEARRIEEEAARKRKIITFEETDITALKDEGKMMGDEEVFTGLKGRISESSGVLTDLSTAATSLSEKVLATQEKQMEAVNMVGRLGGTKGLPPEFKEQAEAILDAFRTMDEMLNLANEEVSTLESGLAEVCAVVADFKSADPMIRLPTVEILNETLRAKASGGDIEVVEDEAPLGELRLDSFDTQPSVGHQISA